MAPHAASPRTTALLTSMADTKAAGVTKPSSVLGSSAYCTYSAMLQMREMHMDCGAGALTAKGFTPKTAM